MKDQISVNRRRNKAAFFGFLTTNLLYIFDILKMKAIFTFGLRLSIIVSFYLSVLFFGICTMARRVKAGMEIFSDV